MTQSSVRCLAALLVGILAAGGFSCEEEAHPVAQAAAATPAAAAQPPPPMRKNLPRSSDWQRVEALLNEQKLQEAQALCEKIRAAAKQAGNDEEWTEALIKEVQLRIGLHGYETAVRFLREEPWPKDLLSQVALELYYASSLVRYLQAYSWEIEHRERVESKGEMDLKAWTKDQIYSEAQAAYARLWAHRAELSEARLDLLGEVLHPGTYPVQVRGTLRDELSYFAVDLLTNTLFWRPEQSSELYRLDFAKLLEEKPQQGADIKLDDSKVHPLLRAMAVLDDLEAFHAAQGPDHKEAALEARLCRLRRLHQSFTDASERARIVASLQQLLPAYRAKPWWSMGMATLAEMVRDGEHDLVRAYAFASDGQRAYPDSPGGQSCQYIKRWLEAPDYKLQTMATDGPNKRSVLILHKNLERLYFRAYALDLVERIESAQDYNLLLGPREIHGLLQDSKPAAKWTVDLPPTPDYKEHNTYVTPPLKQGGLYAVVASMRADFGEADNRILGGNLIITDLVLLTRQHDTSLDVTVVSASTGEPVAGANVLLYRQNYNRHHERIASEHTDEKGLVKLHQNDGQSCYVVAKNGRDATVDRNTFYLYKSYEQPETRAALVYTDRSIYRPLQKVLYKAVAYRGKQVEGRFQVAPHTRLVAVLLDANGQEVAQQALSSNDFGSASGEFTLPSGRLLGGWRIEVRADKSGPQLGAAAIRVEEYKRPTFEVSFKDPEQPLRLNKSATLVGEARYYFGLPVTAGRISFRVSREPVYPFFWSLWGLREIGGEPSQTVASGVVPLGADGTFSIHFTPSADERQSKETREISYRYLVKADLTDEGGETRSAERSFRLGFVAVEATIDSELGFMPSAGGGVFTVRRTSLDGTPRAGEGRYRVLAIKQPAQALLPADELISTRELDDGQLDRPGAETRRGATPGDKLRPRWQSGYSPVAMLSRFADGAEKASGKLSHDAQGLSTLTLPALSPGPYRLRYETTDEFGAKASAWKDFFVAGDNPQAPLPLALPLLLVADKDHVNVGEKARLLITSGLTEQPVFLELFRAGKLLRRTLYRQGALIELPVGEEDRGGLGILAWTVRDHQYLTQSLTLTVPWNNKELKLEFASFRDKLRPGAHETFRVVVRAPSSSSTTAGEALSKGMVELLAYMYDRSLDIFAPHTPPNPLSLYPLRTAIAHQQTSLGSGQEFWISNHLPSPPAPPPLRGASLNFYDSYAIGGLGDREYDRSRPFHHAMRASGLLMNAAAVPAQATPPPPAAPSTPAVDSGLAKAKAEPGKDASGDLERRSRNQGDSGGAATGASPPALRSNFAETAFFQPALITDTSGAAVIEFAVPDSVTSWNVWVHAVTRDLRSGVLHKETRSVKDLMVRPYLPRFFREADSAELKVMVNNAGDRPLSGALRLQISDLDSHEDLLKLFQVVKAEQPFAVDPGKSATLTFPLSAPRRVGLYAFKVVASAGELSDGELRPLPVLPSRLHLSESRFVTLHDKDRRSLSFADLKKNDDPTRISDQVVVTLDAQLFYTVLKALPYLVNYPYECVEQTLNRFLSTGIVSSLYAQYPAVAKLAKEFAARPTELPRFDAPDPNRKMALEESPWLQEAQGGASERGPGHDLINTLDPRIARAQRDSALARLQKAQTALGGFPWFPGGPPSPFMTLYLMHGFAKASEFQVEVPKDMVQRGWHYLALHFREHYAGCLGKNDCSWEFLTLLNYVASAYPDASYTGDALTDKERQDILAASFRRWKEFSPYTKALLALTLKRMGRLKDGQLVFASVMDSGKSAPDQGVFFTPEDRSWLWYNDTIESHAFALRTLTELDPQNAKKDGLVLWLLINKKLNQWKSTRATAEVIYSLAHYLKHEGALGVREEATVTLGPHGELGREQFVFTPDKYAGKTQIVLPGPRVTADPVSAANITVEKATKGYLFASATWNYSTDRLPSQGHGDFFRVERSYFKRQNNGQEFVLKPLGEGEALHPGDEVEVHLSLRSKHAAEYVHLRDPRAAGMEPDVNVSRYKWDLGLVYYEEVRDSGMNFFFEALPAGEYTFKYRLRCNLAGRFRVGPATVQSMYAPEFNAFSAGHNLSIAPAAASSP